jgi:hypothetical protein
VIERSKANKSLINTGEFVNQPDKLAEHVMASLLLLTGISGVAISFADFIGLDTSLLTSKDSISLVLVTVGLLATSLGLERVGRFRRYEQQIEHLKILITRSRGGQQLKGTEEIYRSITRLVFTTRGRVRSFTLGSSTKTPITWPEAVAKRLREMKKTGISVKYETVIAVDFDKLPSDFQYGIDSRFEIYDRNNVKELVSLYLLDLKPPFGLDILVFDRDHVVIAFSPFSGVDRLLTAVLFENQSEIADEFASWFDQIAIRSSVSYEVWMQRKL